MIAQSGARLIEVGTTNRTRLRRLRAGARGSAATGRRRSCACTSRTSGPLGFVEEVSIEALCELGVPVIDDVGSGRARGRRRDPALGDEPAARRSVAAGAALVCCSGDKLLGGPQAGLMVGRADAVAAARAHPLARALRIDKLSLAALEATLLAVPRPRARARARSRCWRCSTAAEHGAGSAGAAPAPTGSARRAELIRAVGQGRAAARCRCSSSRARRWRSAADGPGALTRRAARRRPAGDRADPRGPGAARPAHAHRRRNRAAVARGRAAAARAMSPRR